MMTLKNKLLYILLLLLSVFAVSCDEESENEDINLSRMFRPTTFESYVTENNVSFSWISIADAKYSIEISQDSLLFTTDVQQFSVGENLSYLHVENLLSETLYSARIKSINVNGISGDSGWQELTFITGNVTTLND